MPLFDSKLYSFDADILTATGMTENKYNTTWFMRF